MGENARRERRVAARPRRRPFRFVRGRVLALSRCRISTVLIGDERLMPVGGVSPRASSRACAAADIQDDGAAVGPFPLSEGGTGRTRRTSSRAQVEDVVASHSTVVGVPAGAGVVDHTPGGVVRRGRVVECAADAVEDELVASRQVFGGLLRNACGCHVHSKSHPDSLVHTISRDTEE